MFFNNYNFKVYIAHFVNICYNLKIHNQKQYHLNY